MNLKIGDLVIWYRDDYSTDRDNELDVGIIARMGEGQFGTYKIIWSKFTSTEEFEERVEGYRNNYLNVLGETP